MNDSRNEFLSSHSYTEEEYNDLLEQYNILSRVYSEQCKISDELFSLLLKQNMTLSEFLNSNGK